MAFRNQKEMFLWIWDSRPHFSEVSGLPLLPYGHSRWHWQFCHILPKGSYPRWKHNPENIILMLPEEHSRQNDFDIFNERYADLRRAYYKEFYDREF